MKVHDMPFPWADKAANVLDTVAIDIGRAPMEAIEHSGQETWIGPAADDAKVALGAAWTATRDARDALQATARKLRALAAAERAAFADGG